MGQPLSTEGIIPAGQVGRKGLGEEAGRAPPLYSQEGEAPKDWPNIKQPRDFRGSRGEGPLVSPSGLDLRPLLGAHLQ